MTLLNEEERKKRYRKNLNAMPEFIREALVKLSQEELDHKLEISYNKEGEVICYYCKSGRRFSLTGTHPSKEAKTWYENSDSRYSNAVFLFGTGFGYSLMEVWKNKNPETLVFVFEEDLCIWNAILSYFDLVPLLLSGQIIFLPGPVSFFAKRLDSCFKSIHFVRCTAPVYLFSYTAARNFKTEYKTIYRYLLKQLIMATTYIGNSYDDSLQGLIQMCKNVKPILENPYLSCLKDRYKDVPAFIVGNGPSLDKNIEELKRIQGRGILIAVESAILPLSKHGIKPDILAVVERVKETYLFHFKDMKYDKDITLLGLAVLDERVFPSFSGSKIPLFRWQENANKWMNFYLGDGSSIDAGGNVSHLALEIAHYIGADPIVFVGQDLAYGNDRSTHSKDSIYSSESGKQLEETVKERRTVYVEGNDGTLLPSNTLWVDVKNFIENKIACYKDTEFINATEGGAKIEGTRCETLETVIAKFCNKKIDVRVNEIVEANKANIDRNARKEKIPPFMKEIETQITLLRELVVTTEKGKMESRDSLRLTRSELSVETGLLLDRENQKNRIILDRMIQNDFLRSFLQQAIFSDFYDLNRIGELDSPEKITELFQVHYNFYHHFNIICQSLSVHLELIREELGVEWNKETKQPQLSVCMITYNDEAYIREGIEGVKQIADEIIVVDVGSIDDTMMLAEDTGADVYSYTFKESFCEVKNFCMEKATGKWILFLQPYERISEAHLAKIPELLFNPNVEGYLFYFQYGIEEYSFFSPTDTMRLIRNRKEYEFNYHSFERIQEEQLRNIEDTDIQIVNQHIDSLPWDLSVRRCLLQKEAVENPEDSYLNYRYGVDLLNQQKIEESLVYFETAMKRVNLEYVFAPHLYKCLALDYIMTNQYDKAMTVLNEGIYFYPNYTDLLLFRSEVYKENKQYDRARVDLEQCLSMRERPAFEVPGPEIGVDVIREYLSELPVNA